MKPRRGVHPRQSMSHGGREGGAMKAMCPIERRPGGLHSRIPLDLDIYTNATKPP
jgi:hypothetical protein